VVKQAINADEVPLSFPRLHLEDRPRSGVLPAVRGEAPDPAHVVLLIGQPRWDKLPINYLFNLVEQLWSRDPRRLPDRVLQAAAAR
jgi:hypothetical protein